MSLANIPEKEFNFWFRSYIKNEGRALGLDPHTYFQQILGNCSRDEAKQKAYYIAYHIDKSAYYKTLLGGVNEFSCG